MHADELVTKRDDQIEWEIIDETGEVVAIAAAIARTPIHESSHGAKPVSADVGGATRRKPRAAVMSARRGSAARDMRYSIT
jgi:hypothetical protein